MAVEAAHRVRGSVRLRITLVATVAVAVVLTIAGVALLEIQRRQLLDNLDVTLSQRADAIESSELDLMDGPLPLTLANLAGDDAVVQIVARDGSLLAATSNAIDAAPIGPERPDGQALRTVRALPVEDDEYRVLSRTVDTEVGPAVVHVASNTDDLREVIGRLRTALWLVIPLAAVIMSALVWALVGRTLRPVEAIRREVASIEDLDHRVSPPGTGDEIERLAVTMNDMLDRRATTARRQQQFVADASHELRSPITRMRTELDLAARSDTTPGARERLDGLRSLSEEVDHLAALVDDLLHLARSDSGERAVVRRPVDLDDLVLEEARRIRAVTDLAVDLTAMSAAHLSGDPSQLRRMVRNLLDNAVRHARTRVDVSLAEEPGSGDDGIVTLTVADDGVGIAAADASAIFERFVRLDDARARDLGGTGLGLAITRDIVERHGGTITLDDDLTPGARFTVTLPTTG